MDCEVITLGAPLWGETKDGLSTTMVLDTWSSKKLLKESWEPTWRRKDSAIVRYPGMVTWMRGDRAGFTGSQGQGQDPGVKATKGQILAQPSEMCSNGQKGPRMGGQSHVVMSSLSLQVTTTKGGTEKVQALTK